MTICDGREVVRTKMPSTMDAAALAKIAPFAPPRRRFY